MSLLTLLREDYTDGLKKTLITTALHQRIETKEKKLEFSFP